MLISERYKLPTLDGYSAVSPTDFVWQLHSPGDPAYGQYVQRWTAGHSVNGVCALDLGAKRWSVGLSTEPRFDPGAFGDQRAAMGAVTGHQRFAAPRHNAPPGFGAGCRHVHETPVHELTDITCAGPSAAEVSADAPDPAKPTPRCCARSPSNRATAGRYEGEVSMRLLAHHRPTCTPLRRSEDANARNDPNAETARRSRVATELIQRDAALSAQRCWSTRRWPAGLLELAF